MVLEAHHTLNPWMLEVAINPRWLLCSEINHLRKQLTQKGAEEGEIETRIKMCGRHQREDLLLITMTWRIKEYYV